MDLITFLSHFVSLFVIYLSNCCCVSICFLRLQDQNERRDGKGSKKKVLKTFQGTCLSIIVQLRQEAH